MTESVYQPLSLASRPLAKPQKQQRIANMDLVTVDDRTEPPVCCLHARADVPLDVLPVDVPTCLNDASSVVHSRLEKFQVVKAAFDGVRNGIALVDLQTQAVLLQGLLAPLQQLLEPPSPKSLVIAVGALLSNVAFAICKLRSFHGCWNHRASSGGGEDEEDDGKQLWDEAIDKCPVDSPSSALVRFNRQLFRRLADPDHQLHPHLALDIDKDRALLVRQEFQRDARHAIAMFWCSLARKHSQPGLLQQAREAACSLPLGPQRDYLEIEFERASCELELVSGESWVMQPVARSIALGRAAELLRGTPQHDRSVKTRVLLAMLDVVRAESDNDANVLQPILEGFQLHHSTHPAFRLAHFEALRTHSHLAAIPASMSRVALGAILEVYEDLRKQVIGRQHDDVQAHSLHLLPAEVLSAALRCDLAGKHRSYDLMYQVLPRAERAMSTLPPHGMWFTSLHGLVVLNVRLQQWMARVFKGHVNANDHPKFYRYFETPLGPAGLAGAISKQLDNKQEPRRERPASVLGAGRLHMNSLSELFRSLSTQSEGSQDSLAPDPGASSRLLDTRDGDSESATKGASSEHKNTSSSDTSAQEESDDAFDPMEGL
eukprot:m.464813 g.464813  ORF g.464813 m.464813 type:complete len:603 (+) comp20357_c2_seq6:137-1945(+)